jgi:GrpB-like predicted nucleotidyltransferase (UPF0157 family)
MLTPNEERYLSKISDDQMVEVVPWNPRGLEVAEQVINEIKSVLPENEIVFIGSMPLKIAGQKDIDLSVLSPAADFPVYQPKLEQVFGKPNKLGATSIAWHFLWDGYEVGIYLTDPETSDVQNQIKVFNLLKDNPNLLKEYESIKLSAAQGTYKEYQIKKYNFYHRILGVE